MINIPFYYPELSHPLHDIDKMSIVTKFTFITCLIHLQVQEVELGILLIMLYLRSILNITNEPHQCLFILKAIVFIEPKKYQIM